MQFPVFRVFVSLHLSMFTTIQTRICEWCGAEGEQGVHWWDFASGKARFLENWNICVCLEQSWSTTYGFLSTAETQPCWYSIQEHSCLSNIAYMVGFLLYLSSVMNSVKNILLLWYTKYMVDLPFPFSLCRCSAVLTTLYKWLFPEIPSLLLLFLTEVLVPQFAFIDQWVVSIGNPPTAMNVYCSH